MYIPFHTFADSLFLSLPWMCPPIASGLHGFWWEISCLSYWGSWHITSLATFKIISLSFDDLTMYLGMGLSELVLFVVDWTSWIYRFFRGIWKVFSHYFLFPPFSSFLSFWDSHNVSVGVIDVSHMCLGSVRFSSFFSFLLLRLNNFNCPHFKFADSFFFIHSNLLFNCSSKFFISVIVLFSSRILVWFPFIIFFFIDVLILFR